MNIQCGLSAVVLFLWTTTALSEDFSSAYNEIRSHYVKRADLAENDKAIELAESHLQKYANAPDRYETLQLVTRAFLWKSANVIVMKKEGKPGERDKGKERDVQRPSLLKATNYSKEAMNIRPNSATSRYWYAFALGMYGLSRYTVPGYNDAKEAVKIMETTMALKTDSGEPGETEDDYGPLRGIGSAWSRKGNRKPEGVAYLRKAFDSDRSDLTTFDTFNSRSYGDALWRLNRQVEACEVYAFALGIRPEDMGNEKIPENTLVWNRLGERHRSRCQNPSNPPTQPK